MKRFLSACLVLAVAAYAGNGVAQAQQGVTISKDQVASDVSLAATKAKVAAGPFLIGGFVDAASNQKRAFIGVYKDVPKDVRVARLARYLSAKDVANAETASSGHPVQDIADFHWGYITNDVAYVPARFEAPTDARLLRVESPAGLYDFANAGEKIKPGMTFVIPAAEVTATFALGEKKALWTGDSSSGIVKVTAASTNRGCEIFVRSKPSDAAVYFNGKEWYQRTDTSSVRDSGTWEVVVKLKGYKEWRERRRLTAGESWTIDAVLSKPE